MKTLRTRPKYFIINVRALVLIYIFLVVLIILFSLSFLRELLKDGAVPEPLSMAAFFTIPAALLIFLFFSGPGMARDFFSSRPGGRFRARLMACFIIVVILAAAPVIVITSLSVNELVRFWKTIDVDRAMKTAQDFATEAYSLKLEKLESLIREEQTALTGAGFSGRALPGEAAALQDFRMIDGRWTETAFTGDGERRLDTPPAFKQGFAPRELPRDRDTIRYILRPAPDGLRIISGDLGRGFDASLEIIEDERARFNIIDSIRFNIKRLLVFYHVVFFLPAMLMTLIIAVSFVRRMAWPITELTEATKRVAEGDFSIRILPRRKDELGVLVKSFNAMVQDLEESRSALIKAEKISIWQNMAQQLAHEIKNPLTPIRLSAERVLRRWRKEPEKIGEILESSMKAIIQEVEGLSTLLNEFRTLSRPMEPSSSSTNIKELMEETIAPYRSSYPDVRFDTEYTEGVVLKIDRSRLSQVLTNLIINGIDAMAGSGLMEIRTDLVKKGESRYCRLSVRDTGKGISGQDGRLIFTPYYTTKESGTGLGLPIVERIVNDHGGTIWFNSAEGLGATFFIDLPVEENIF
ncbi:MAG: HAMP domain-containing protein [Treponema sp.]|jgi:nitrogen fixation/metabolism regulation signal transduction histidine kinase|nr:HAMP domain-containing protein [Treponema sp.]